MIRGTLAAPAAALVFAAPAGAAQPYNVGFHAFALPKSGITFATAPTGTWTSPWFSTGFGFRELVASWNANTPPGTWIEVTMRGITDTGELTKAYVMGRWAYGDGDIQRTSVGGQGDENGYIAIDTFFARAQFEKAWMSSTGGIVYVIHPAAVPLPPAVGGNW